MLVTDRKIAMQAQVHAAHEQAIWSLSWHPLGHLLCSGANDNLVKFWSRNRPGDGRKREREEGDEAFDDELEMRMTALASMAQQQSGASGGAPVTSIDMAAF